MPLSSTAFADAARLTSLDLLDLYRAALARGLSEREAADRVGAARSTLREHKTRVDDLDVDPAERVFFSSPAGLLCLQRILLAVHVGFGLLCPVGLPRICQFLSLARLDLFLGSSHGAQFAFASAVYRQVVTYGQTQTRQLGATMPWRAITLLCDETFHAGQALFVALEPLSRFPLVESYGPACDAATWDAKVTEALANLPRVALVQVGCDGGSALASFVAQRPDVWLSPDLFHVQYNVLRAVAPALASLARRACGARRQQAQTALDQVIQAQRDMGRAYHPFDLKTGQPRSERTVIDELHQHADVIGQAVLDLGLSLKATDALGSARRVFTTMGATIGFIHREIARCRELLNMPVSLRQQVTERLVPALYLRRVASKTDGGQERTRLEQIAHELVAPLQAPDSLWSQQPAEVRAASQAIAQGCADLFQRASSATEGRNHRLRVLHDGLTTLSPTRLGAQTVAQSFVVEDEEGTTAAERFFGQRPDDLMRWLSERVPLPPRARSRRTAEVKPALLN